MKPVSNYTEVLAAVGRAAGRFDRSNEWARLRAEHRVKSREVAWRG